MSRWQNLTINQISKDNNKYLINHSLKNNNYASNNIFAQKNIKQEYINKNNQQKYQLLIAFLNLNRKKLNINNKYLKNITKGLSYYQLKQQNIWFIINYFFFFFNNLSITNRQIINLIAKLTLNNNKYYIKKKQLIKVNLYLKHLKITNYNSFIIFYIILSVNKYYKNNFFFKYLFRLLSKLIIKNFIKKNTSINQLNIFLFDSITYLSNQHEIKIINNFYLSWFDVNKNYNLNQQQYLLGQKYFFFIKTKYYELLHLRNYNTKIFLNNLYLNKTLNLSLNIIEEYLYFTATPNFLNKKNNLNIDSQWIRNVIVFSFCFNNINLFGRLLIYLISYIKRPKSFLIMLKNDIDLIFKLLWKNYSLLQYKLSRIDFIYSRYLRRQWSFNYFFRTYFYQFRQLQSIIVQLSGRFTTTGQASVFLTKTGLLGGYRRKEHKKKYLYFFNTVNNVLGSYGIKIWFII